MESSSRVAEDVSVVHAVERHSLKKIGRGVGPPGQYSQNSHFPILGNESSADDCLVTHAIASHEFPLQLWSLMVYCSLIQL